MNRHEPVRIGTWFLWIIAACTAIRVAASLLTPALPLLLVLGVLVALLTWVVTPRRR